MQAFYNKLAAAPKSWQAQFTSLTDDQVDDLKKQGRDWYTWAS